MRQRALVLAIVVALAVALAAAIAIYLARRSPASSTGPAGGSGSTTGTRSAETTQRVRKLSPADRQRLVEQIAAARERRRAAASSSSGGGGSTPTSTPPPSLPDDTISLDQVSGTLKTALADAIPLLAECYGEQGSGHTAAVEMVMTSEPEVGTVIDTTELRDEHGQALPRELDDCLRTTIESLGLPPLEQGGRLPLKYSFVFD